MSLRLILSVATLCLGFMVTPAHAKLRLGIISFGDEMFEVAEFPADIVAANPSAKSLKAGYKCSHFALMWSDVLTWDCKLVATTGENSYTEIPAPIQAQLAADPQYAFDKAHRSFWNHYAFRIALGGFVALTAFGMVVGNRKKPVVDQAHADTMPA